MRQIINILLLTLALNSIAQNDTIKINGLIGIISSVDSLDYYLNLKNEKNVKRYQLGPFEKKDLNKIEQESSLNGNNVYRIADTLFLKLNNGNIEKLINKPFIGESAVNYQYVDFINEINFYLVLAKGWESTYLILLNIESGSLTKLSSEITIYPDLNIILGTQYDLDVGFYYNQIEKFRIEDNELRLQWGYRTEEWGFYQPILIKNDLIYFKKFERERGAKENKMSFSKLEMK